MRNEYEQLKADDLESALNNQGESLLKDEEDKGPTRILYKPEDLEEFYRTQITQLSKSIDELNKISSFFDSTKSLSHFGYNLFTNRDTMSFFDNMPLSPDYNLGSGDELIVSLWGEVEKEETTIINRDGNIFLEDIGIISIGGLTLAIAKKKILKAYSKTYSTIKGLKPSTFVNITLGQLKGLNVNILGFVKSPGVYALHPFTDPFTALFYAGGIDTTGSLRNIQIFRNGVLLDSLDLYSILHSGSLNKKVRLLNEDIIFVPPRKSKVIINGSVVLPGYFELTESETALDLLNYSGGLTSKASSLITLKRIYSPFNRKNDDLAINYFLVSIDSLSNYKLQNGDSLGFSFISDYYPTITINGWIKRPGKYPFIKGMTLLELIEIGGGLFDNSWLLGSEGKIITIIKHETADTKKTVKLDFQKIINGSETIYLNPYDEVQILKNKFNNYNNYVSIKGEVVSEGIFSISNRSILDLINDTGGFTTNAFKEGIELYRDTIKVGLNSLSIVPLNGDSIFVPVKSGAITILGSVNNPGPVSFQKGLTINQFIDLAGGYTVYANKKDVFIIYPNGISKKKSRFKSPKVLEGSTIMVSASQLVTQQTDYLAITQQITSIIGSLATVALIINSN
ncbi:SLBB domain-containing protein [Candidatus Marinimicrobia bacterium]|nr:SLBB domain-containing protein [Candidatus Neomarinimicrobiota bacterium]